MGVYYPQAALTLRILWEDFKFKSDPRLQDTYALPVLAKTVTVKINDYTHADEFDAEIDYKNFPFDPRCIRACGVSVHMENVGEIFHGSNELRSLEATVANTVFQGFVDEESISFDDSKRVVRMEGRDFTSLLVDRPYAKGTLPLTSSLDVVLQNLLKDLAETQKLRLDNRVVDAQGKKEPLPTLAKFFEDKHQLSGSKNVDRHQTYWEVIQDLVARAGLIAFIEQDALVLTKPRVLYSPEKAKTFVYGRNIKNLTYKRRLGRKKFFNVIVRSIAGKEVIEAKIPADATASWSAATGIPKGEVKMPEVGKDGEAVDQSKWKPAPYLSFRIPNCKSKDQLIKYAQEIYEEVGRQQIEGSLDTRDMETTTISNECFDILKLRIGSPIQVRVDQGDLAGISSIADIAQRVSYLEARGYEPSIATALATSMDKFADVFYTKAVTFSLSNDDGFKAHIEFINFIDTKYQAKAT